MKTCNLLAPAKINLYLELLGERVDNYHELIMVLQSIELSDYIKINFNGINDGVPPPKKSVLIRL